MSEGKGWGKTVLGWFVVQDGANQESAGDFGSPTVDAAAVEPPTVAHADSALAEMPQVFEKDVPAAPGGVVDFDAVFDAAGIGMADRERIGKSVELLKSLPAGTDPTVKRQIVGASLKAFGVEIDKIIETGVEQIQALEGYIRNGASETAKMSEESETLVRDYEQKIAEIRALIHRKVEEQQSVIKHCNDKKLEVQQILEFFGQETVAKVVRESPRLHEPQPKQ
ncbi:MAG: hypothetical protein HYU52_14490 [Acidobacteria bacterium]|nr:hypothetical protein [Acidobacteriota bacterium]